MRKENKNTKEQKLISICGCKPQHVYLLLLFLSNKRMFAGEKKSIIISTATVRWVFLSLYIYIRYKYFFSSWLFRTSKPCAFFCLIWQCEWYFVVFSLLPSVRFTNVLLCYFCSYYCLLSVPKCPPNHSNGVIVSISNEKLGRRRRTKKKKSKASKKKRKSVRRMATERQKQLIALQFHSTKKENTSTHSVT